MGRMVGKLAIVLLLSNYNFKCEQEGDLEFSPVGVGLLPKDGIKIRISKIETNCLSFNMK
jgi:cytochrome P450 family 6